VLPRAYWFLFAGTLVNRAGSFVAPFLAIYLTDRRGVTVERAGWVIALYGVGCACAAPLGGLLADRIGRRATLLLGTGLGAAAMLHLGVARSLAHLAVAAPLLGLAGDLYRPAITAAVADLVPTEQRGRAYGLLYWAINLGVSFASVVAGLLARSHFFALFVGDAVTTLAFGLLVWRFVPETRPAQARASLPLRSQLAPYRDSVLIAFLGFSILSALLFQQFQVTLPVDLMRHGVTPRLYGILIALNPVLVVLLQPFAEPGLKRFRRSRVLAAAALLTGAGFGMNALGAGSLLYGAGIAVWTLGEIVGAPASMSVPADLAPAELRGAYQGALFLSFAVPIAIAPVIGSQVLGHLGPCALWGGCFVVGVAAAVGHLAIGPARRRRLAALRRAEKVV
jgi:MFS family permease